jgi:thiamine transport system substrate-binding protein
MNSFLIIALLGALFIGRISPAAKPVISLDDAHLCAKQLVETEVRYLPGVQSVLETWDRRLHYLRRDIIQRQENLAQLEFILSTKNFKNEPPEHLNHLLANAAQSCWDFKKEYEQHLKKLFLFAGSIVLFLATLLLYLALFGFSSPFPRREFYLFLLFFACPLHAANEITVYTYDSLAGKGGLGPLLIQEFKKKTGTDLKLVSYGSAGEAINQVILEGAGTKADAVLGVDSYSLGKVRSSALFAPLERGKLLLQVEHFLQGEDPLLVPFDYGFLAFLYDSKRNPSLAKIKTFKEFAARQITRKNLVMADPRTSSLGLGFLLWSQVLFQGSDLEGIWRGIAKQIMTLTPGWSGSYGLFVKEKADTVLSYSTSPAYHIEKEGKHEIQALAFEEGHLRQVEGLSLVKSSKKIDRVQLLSEILLSPEIQRQIPLLQYMYPAIRDVKLPESFRGLPIPKAVPADPKLVHEKRREWLQQWKKIFSETR